MSTIRQALEVTEFRSTRTAPHMDDNTVVWVAPELAAASIDTLERIESDPRMDGIDIWTPTQFGIGYSHGPGMWVGSAHFDGWHAVNIDAVTVDGTPISRVLADVIADAGTTLCGCLSDTEICTIIGPRECPRCECCRCTADDDDHCEACDDAGYEAN